MLPVLVLVVGAGLACSDGTVGADVSIALSPAAVAGDVDSLRAAHPFQARPNPGSASVEGIFVVPCTGPQPEAVVGRFGGGVRASVSADTIGCSGEATAFRYQGVIGPLRSGPLQVQVEHFDEFQRATPLVLDTTVILP